MEVATHEDESLMSEEEENIKEDLRVLQEDERGKVPLEECVYDEAGMLQKLEEIKLVIPGKEEVPWIETLVLSTEKIELEKGDDLEREKAFYNLALKGALEGLAFLKQLEVPIDRPDDYFAEMIKTDGHMAKVKTALLKETKQIKDAQERTKRRIEQKYLKNSQTLQHAERSKAKQEEQEAIRRWRKIKRNNQMDEEFPEELLDPNSQLRKQLSANRSKKRQPLSNAKKKAKKYGAGKRVNKRNTAQSANDTSEWSVARNKSPSFSFKTKKKKPQTVNRPGKRKRQQARGSKSNSSAKKRKNPKQ
jgi:rRNA-processing protein EBP2